MTDIYPVPLPQMGANDTHAIIVEWSRNPGEQVRKGETICIAETTKSIFEVESDGDGYLTPLAAAGDEVEVGSFVALVSKEPMTTDRALEHVRTLVAAATPQPSEAVEPRPGVTWTFKAEMTAREHGVEIREVPSKGDRITESDVLAYIESRSKVETPRIEVRDLVDDPYPGGRPERLLIVGGGEGAVQLLDALFKTPGQRAVGIVDDNRELQGKSVAGVPVIGPVVTGEVVEMHRRGEFDAAIISVSTSIPFRQRVFDEWRSHGIRFANVIHPSVQIGMNASIGQGNILLAFCQVGPCATIGDNNFLSAYCSIEHHGRLGNHCSFGPGVVTSSRAMIGDRVRFGTGIFIEPHITIGRDSVIGSGCILWKDVPENVVLKSKLNYSVRERMKS